MPAPVRYWIATPPLNTTVWYRQMTSMPSTGQPPGNIASVRPRKHRRPTPNDGGRNRKSSAHRPNDDFRKRKSSSPPSNGDFRARKSSTPRMNDDFRNRTSSTPCLNGGFRPHTSPQFPPNSKLTHWMYELPQLESRTELHTISAFMFAIA